MSWRDSGFMQHQTWIKNVLEQGCPPTLPLMKSWRFKACVVPKCTPTRWPSDTLGSHRVCLCLVCPESLVPLPPQEHSTIKPVSHSNHPKGNLWSQLPWPLHVATWEGTDGGVGGTSWWWSPCWWRARPNPPALLGSLS